MHFCASGFLEQGTGVEPASEAWEAPIIADILTLHVGYYNRVRWGFQVYFAERQTDKK